MANPPLHGIKVIDLSLLLPGPLCSMYLADMGAEVIKIEHPKRGDLTRYFGEKIKKGDFEEGSLFLMLNRNKKSLSLNIKQKKSHSILYKLLEDADILLENFRPGTMEKMGLDYGQLKEKFPKLIYCSITGYGQQGPYKDLAGHDANYIAYAGLLGLTGTEESGPVLPAFQTADVAGGTFVALSSILAALHGRHATNKGQYIDVSMLDGAFNLMPLQIAEYIASRKAPQRGELFLSGGVSNYHVYQCKDKKYIMLAAFEERFFRYFLRQVNEESILDNIRWSSEALAKLKPKIEKIFLSKTRDEWEELFANPETCLSPINDLNEVWQDPQINYRKMIRTMKHPDLGEITIISSPFHFSETPCQYKLHPPKHGEHTETILSELGYSKDEQLRLKKERIV